MNRRSILGLLSAAPFAGKAVAEQAVTSIGSSVPPGGYGLSSGVGQASPANNPLMEHQSAVRNILGDMRAMSEIRSELAEGELRGNPYIDPDIQIMKTWSPMAKITFQRQRNVDRAIAEMQDTRWDRPNRYIRAFQSRMDKLMWGK